MNFELKGLPSRAAKPRDYGLTMVMDKGMSNQEVENFLSIASPHVDLVKLGFGTALITPNLEAKLGVYDRFHIPVYFGGTLFEAFLAKGQFKGYLEMIKRFNVKYVEISDGSIEMEQSVKCDYIKKLSASVTVLSEVGSKDIDTIIPPYKWIELMSAELEAGAWKVIAEARESGTVGIFRSTGEVRSGLIQEILTRIPGEKIIWEAPNKSQQAWFIKLLGPNVNLGNIAPGEVLGLEAMRMGLRGDTFDMLLPKKK